MSDWRLNIGGPQAPSERTYDDTQVIENFDTEFDKHFPAPAPREHQKEVVKATVEGIGRDNKDVVMIDAPPGFGKSITLDTILKMLDGDSYYVTPLKSLQDQLVEDDFIGNRLTEIKGRSNYPCILPEAEEGETVDVAKCQREDDFQCEIKSQCPYYAQKERARQDKTAVMNLSYMMSVPMTPDPDDGQFSPRRVMVIDECQGLEDWAINFIGFTISKQTIPRDVWDNITWPSERKLKDFDSAVQWLRDEVRPAANSMLDYISNQPIKSDDDVSTKDRLQDFVRKVDRFLNDVEDNHWVHTVDMRVNKNRPNNKRVEFKPIKVGRFLDSLVWSKADHFILSSATIPKGDWLEEIGLQDADSLRCNVPSGFPVENRPIITSEAVGKMTYKERDKTIKPMVKKIKQIAEHHDGEKGIIHCRGYNYIKMFKDACIKTGLRQWFNDTCVVQDREDREGSLESWVQGDKQIFLSVNMAEGIDLKGDKCRWQVLLKTLYPNMGDQRVSYRVKEMSDWQWYNGKAVIQLEQAYGRAVRSDDDWAIMYILDSSAVNLINKNKGLFHEWFLEGVQ